MSTLNFTTANPSLAKVAAFPVNKPWVALCVRHLPADQQAETLAILEAINPEQFATITDTSFAQVSLLKYQDGVYQKAYPLSLQSYKGNLAVSTGQNIIEFTSESLEELMAEFAITKIEQYDEIAMTITLEVDDELTVLSLPLRLDKKSWEASSADPAMFLKQLQMAFRKGDISKIADKLVEAKVGGSSTGSDLRMVKINELPELEEIAIRSVKKVDISGRKSYILTIDLEGEDVTVWAPSSLAKLFNLGIEINSDTKLIVRFYINRNGKQCSDCKLIDYVRPELDENLMSLFA